jgi:Clr5 domain
MAQSNNMTKFAENKKRATRISKEAWAAVKPIICDLYSHITLEQLMEEMRLKHGFMARYVN